MDNQKWVDFEKQVLVDSDNKVTETKIISKLKGSNLRAIELIDLILKGLGIVAIFTPLLILLLQNHREKNSLRNKSLSEIYISTVKELTKQENGGDLEQLLVNLDSLRIENRTKFYLYGNENIGTLFTSLIDINYLEINLKKLNRYIIKSDSIIIKTKKLFEDYNSISPLSFSKDSFQYIECVKKFNSNENGLVNLNMIYNSIDEKIKTLNSTDSIRFFKIAKVLDTCKTICTRLTLITTDQVYPFIKGAFSNQDKLKIDSTIVNELYISRAFIRNRISDIISIEKKAIANEFETAVFNKIK